MTLSRVARFPSLKQKWQQKLEVLRLNCYTTTYNIKNYKFVLVNGLQYFAKRNETKRNGTLRNGTLRNGTLRNGTLRNGTLRNGTLRNGTLRNGTLRNGYTSANAPKFFALATKS